LCLHIVWYEPGYQHSKDIAIDIFKRKTRGA